jgi:hypothetical protein
MIANEWIQTYTGKKFSLTRPRPDDVEIKDIAHALSLQARFNGHTTRFYSVAQHCVLVAHACPTRPMWGLLHDAAEAYTGDLVRPLKKLLCPAIASIDRGIIEAVARRFGLPLGFERSEEVHRADFLLLATEKRDLLPHDIDWGYELPEPVSNKPIWPVGSDEAQRLFLELFEEISEEA